MIDSRKIMGRESARRFTMDRFVDVVDISDGQAARRADRRRRRRDGRGGV